MNIFNHLIKDTEIIGVGEINTAESNPGTCRRELQYSFRVYTKASSITIYSPAYAEDGVEKADAWLKKYIEVRHRIAEQIGELKEVE